jgi:hypothetical protein
MIVFTASLLMSSQFSPGQPLLLPLTLAGKLAASGRQFS